MSVGYRPTSSANIKACWGSQPSSNITYQYIHYYHPANIYLFKVNNRRQVGLFRRHTSVGKDYLQYRITKNIKKSNGDRDSTKSCTALFPLWSPRENDIQKKTKKKGNLESRRNEENTRKRCEIRLKLLTLNK